MHAIPTDLDTQEDALAGGTMYCPTCGDTYSALCDRCPDDGTKLVRDRAETDPLAGVVLDGRYRILRPLAQGAMGTVYEGVQLPIKRPIAIKLIREELGHDDASVKRFLREAKLLTRIAHPNIVDVIDYGETQEGRLYLIMELLRGRTLDVAIAQVGRFAVPRACEIGLQLCDALVAAHAHGVVHRDLKPANISLLAELGDWVKVLDFGLAKSFTAEPSGDITFTGAVLGTPIYMAPEAIHADVADPRSDLYALGCILFELLTGGPPFVGESTALVLARHLDDPPPALPDHVPAPLRALVDELLAKDPAHRPQTALAVRTRLERCVTDEPPLDDLPTLVTPALVLDESPLPAPLPAPPTVVPLPPMLPRTARGTREPPLAPPPPRAAPTEISEPSRTTMWIVWLSIAIAILACIAIALLP